MSVLVNATPLGAVAQWATRSQEQARRNAMAACTALAARRLERDEVNAYVAAALAARERRESYPESSPSVGERALG
jgi:hypothetical protein